MPDHDRSAQLARESGAADVYPRWGAYTRVDGLAADAFWCWPGIVVIAISRMRGITPGFGRRRDRSDEPRAGGSGPRTLKFDPRRLSPPKREAFVRKMAAGA